MKKPLLIVAITIATFVSWTIARRFIPSYIDYRGEKIKLTKYYLTYEDYKDDPNNIDPSEIARVQQLVANAPIPNSFSNYRQIVDAGFDIHFPGYGVGGLSDGTKDSENSLIGLSVEIPQADKDRYFVFRHTGEKYVLVDSFVASNVPLIILVKQKNNNFVYSATEGEIKLIRPAIPPSH